MQIGYKVWFNPLKRWDAQHSFCLSFPPYCDLMDHLDATASNAGHRKVSKWVRTQEHRKQDGSHS